MLALGFSISALALYAALSLIGDWAIADARARAAVWLAAGGALAALLARDALRARAACVLGPSWRRQTPKRYLDRWGVTTAAFVWGLDTGLVFTTFRVTSLSWAALAVTGLGLVPWWAGAAYALGFVVPLLMSILAFGKRTDPTGETDPEPGWLVHRLFRCRPALRLLALATLGTAGAGCLATAMLRLG
ncbi:MAG: hypothetical protein ACRD0K_28300 [Egibacteraceae bacterium]